MKIAKFAFLSFIMISLALAGCTKKETTEGKSGSSTLAKVLDRGTLIGGVTTGVPGYSAPDADGKWVGFDVDFIRAVAAAVLKDADKVEFRPLTAKERFTALQTGEIDVLSRVSTWTATRDNTLGINWAGINFYDGQAFLVPKSKNIKTLEELDGASITVQAGTTTELNLADYFRTHNLKYELITFEQNEQAATALETKRADAFTSDSSQLYGLRSKMNNPDDYEVLPYFISKEPLGPVVSEGDDGWLNIVVWTYNAMVAAEEFGVTSQNVDGIKSSTNNPEIKRLLGVEGSLGEGLGLDSEWAYRVIKQVGNYGEIFKKHLGADSPLNMKRDLNALWTDGGLQYALPFR